MICKRRQGSAHPFAAHALLSEAEATRIKNSFQQPIGSAARREIPIEVRKNIAAYAPRCAQQGVISVDASTTLVAWSQGTLHRKPRPLKYNFLNFRQSGHVAGAVIAGEPWDIPARFRVLDLSPPGDEEDSASDAAEVDDDFKLPNRA